MIRSKKQPTPLRPNRGSKAKPPAPVTRKRARPRRGRVIDRERLAWCAGLPCCITGERPVTVHHIRFCGSPKDDTRILPLVPRLHMLTSELPGQPCIERGKEVFEASWGVDIEGLVLKHQRLYELHSAR